MPSDQRRVSYGCHKTHRRPGSVRAPRASFECLHGLRGKGLEFGRPQSIKLRTAWKLFESANEGLFCQMMTIPLLQKHRILTEVAGSGLNVVKYLPPLIINDAGRDWSVTATRNVIADAHRVPGAVWDLGRTLAGSALKSRKASWSGS